MILIWQLVETQLMSQSLAAETASRAFPLPCTLFAKSMQLCFQEAVAFFQLMLDITSEKRRN